MGTPSQRVFSVMSFSEEWHLKITLFCMSGDLERDRAMSIGLTVITATKNNFLTANK